MWGAVGAVVVRASLTIGVLWLLGIPGLVPPADWILVWIAYGLLTDDNDGPSDRHVKPAMTFWAAMRTIVIADAVMGLDNVLAVAGAAHGSMLLVVMAS